MDLKDVEAMIKKAKVSWLQENTSIRDKVFSILDRQRDNLIAQLMGFENRYGKWEINNCNNRAANSFIGGVIKEIGNNAVHDWIVNQLDLNKLTKLTPEQTDSVIKEAKKHYINTLSQRLNERAMTAANDHINSLMPAIVNHNEVLSDIMLNFTEPTEQSLKRMRDILDKFNPETESISISEEKLQSWLFRCLNTDASMEVIKQITSKYNEIMESKNG
ncbi:hypothetical protein LCGC14_1519330 [marine sediment metagenome]|uniref:Uncharacterized protein n=1 Tax=marine sediment metagenome TaxID=412755 RepID=A0A0F9IZB3_9ZZZZ